MVSLLADASAVPPTVLFRGGSGQLVEGAHPSRDAARLCAALFAETSLTPVVELASAFGWTLERTEAAVDELAARAPALGLRVHRLKRDVALVRDVDAVDDEELERLSRSRYARARLSLTEARVLAAVVAGGDARPLQGNAKQVALASIRNAGYVSDDDSPSVSDDVAFSLMLTGPTTFYAGRCRESEPTGGRRHSVQMTGSPMSREQNDDSRVAVTVWLDPSVYCVTLLVQALVRSMPPERPRQPDAARRHHPRRRRPAVRRRAHRRVRGRRAPLRPSCGADGVQVPRSSR